MQQSFTRLLIINQSKGAYKNEKHFHRLHPNIPRLQPEPRQFKDRPNPGFYRLHHHDKGVGRNGRRKQFFHKNQAICSRHGNLFWHPVLHGFDRRFGVTWHVDLSPCLHVDRCLSIYFLSYRDGRNRDGGNLSNVLERK